MQNIFSGQPNDALATALNEVANGGGLVGHEEAGHPHDKDPLSALAAAAELDQVRNDVAVVSFMVLKLPDNLLFTGGTNLIVLLIIRDSLNKKGSVEYSEMYF